MKVECINDTNRPSDFPLSKWIVKGEKYTISRIDLLIMSNEYGCQVEEIDTESEHLYKYFALSRFKPVDKEEFTDSDIKELLLEISEEQEVYE